MDSPFATPLYAFVAAYLSFLGFSHFQNPPDGFSTKAAAVGLAWHLWMSLCLVLVWIFYGPNASSDKPTNIGPYAIGPKLKRAIFRSWMVVYAVLSLLICINIFKFKSKILLQWF